MTTVIGVIGNCLPLHEEHELVKCSSKMEENCFVVGERKVSNLIVSLATGGYLNLVIILFKLTIHFYQQSVCSFFNSTFMLFSSTYYFN